MCVPPGIGPKGSLCHTRAQHSTHAQTQTPLMPILSPTQPHYVLIDTEGYDWKVLSTIDMQKVLGHVRVRVRNTLGPSSLLALLAWWLPAGFPPPSDLRCVGHV